MNSKIGEWAFLVFVIIAIIAGLANGIAPFGADALHLFTAVMVVLGIIVGFLNISEKETTAFLISAVALLVAGTANFGALGSIGTYISSILGFIGAFVAPATVIVGLKAIYALGKKK